MKVIMIIDDSLSSRALVIDLCTSIGEFEFLEGEDGLDALEQLSQLESTIDLIICDQNMPEMKGMELLLKVKQEEKLKNIPFVFITSESDEAVIVEALSNGADEYMTKPLEEGLFLEKIGQFL